MASQGVGFGLCLGLVLLQSGCGAYEQAQQAAQKDRKLRTDYLVQKTGQLETMQQLSLWYLQFQRQNAKSPAALSDLLDSVSNPTAPRTARSIATMRRLTANPALQINGVLALEKWGTAAVVSELEALSEKSNNFGLQIQVQRIVPILKSRQ